MRHDKQGFDKEVCVKFPVGEEHGVLTRSFHYTDKDGIRHTAPAGMPLDGLSNPLKHLLDSGFRSRFFGASVLHDSYCIIANHLWEEGDKAGARALRKEGDLLWKEMILFLGASRFEAWIYYRGVRIGAQKLWL